MSEQLDLARNSDHAGKSPVRRALMLGALGVVFGDIGTSPLYALREAFSELSGLAVTTEHVHGVVSLIIWSLFSVISLKYLVVMLRAHNRGEGGILALVALLGPWREARDRRRHLFLVLLGLLGAALLYGDSTITPAISVLSAIEGLSVAAPDLSHWAMPLALVVLGALFAVQSQGSSRVGALFGPVMLFWFVIAGLLGLGGIVRHPAILQALDPHWGLVFLIHNPTQGFFALGAVFLAVTGAEALYADMGHFGASPIRRAWFMVALPALILNYLGQGAMLLTKTGAVQHPFFALAPSWALYPLIGLATLAAIIASQAVITSAFSLTRQAVQLDVLPRMNIHQTSSEAYGQIYVPLVNWLLLLATMGLVIGFGDSSSLAGAYGIAVSANMVITTILVLFLQQVFGRAAWWIVPCACGFLVIDSAFFLANGAKIVYGGWYPLSVAMVLIVVMSTWRRGRQLLRERLQPASEPLQVFIQRLHHEPPVRVPGVAVFLTATPPWTPPMLQHHLEYNRALQEQVILLTVQVEGVPRVPASRRLEWHAFGAGVHGVLVRYGFNQAVNVPVALRLAQEVYRVNLDLEAVTYYVGRETMIPSAEKPGMALWREHLFAFLARNALSAAAYYGIPPEHVVELGIQVEL